jgi:spoIIIJ-associated protein
MPITDKVAAAKQMGEFLQAVISSGGFRLKYRITVDPPIAQNREWEHPEILVEFAGPDSALLLERSGELLRSFELLASEILHLQGNEHEKIWFDCKNFRAMRIDELQLAARVAAEQVRRTSEPYRFGPMSSRERRIVHLALREEKDLRTESDGEGGRRSVVVYPGNYKTMSATGARRERRPV